MNLPFRKPTPPTCMTCGSLHPGIVTRYNAQGKVSGHVFLCGSCEYLEKHPDALRVIKPRRIPLQSERLF